MLDKEIIAKNISELRKKRGLTLKEVGDKVGVAASTIQRYERAKIVDVKKPVLDSIAHALGASPRDIYEDGPELISNAIPADMSQMMRIPVVGRVAAGLACHAEENIEDYAYCSKDIIISGETYVYLRVVGDSMSPRLMEGDLVLVRCQNMVDSGDYAVVLIDNEDGVVKKLYFGKNYIELISENPYYPPRRFEDSEMERIRIYGKVIESRRRF
ncbi:MAG: helix-turn-helix domain-containing protein [Oscillospiraceae bacterium]|nr:helix-turn-helix domain-containing protein [Oscillospiraceae bacterium]